MCSCYSILECYDLFSGVELSMRSFAFICCYRHLIAMATDAHAYNIAV